MKRSQIEVGKRYTDNKGNTREVIAEGPEYVLYVGQFAMDNLRYKLITKKRGPYPVGSERNSTRASFASWAKAEVQA